MSDSIHDRAGKIRADQQKIKENKKQIKCEKQTSNNVEKNQQKKEKLREDSEIWWRLKPLKKSLDENLMDFKIPYHAKGLWSLNGHSKTNTFMHAYYTTLTYRFQKNKKTVITSPPKNGNHYTLSNEYIRKFDGGGGPQGHKSGYKEWAQSDYHDNLTPNEVKNHILDEAAKALVYHERRWLRNNVKLGALGLVAFAFLKACTPDAGAMVDLKQSPIEATQTFDAHVD